jgi:hypothetical protein
MKDFEELKKELDAFMKQKEKELIAKRRKRGKKEKREA